MEILYNMTKRTPLFTIGLLIASASLSFAQNSDPKPFISIPLVPDTAKPGEDAFVLTVNGSGFVAQSAVKWNGHPRPTTFVNDTQLTARISAGDIATASSAIVTVVNPKQPNRISNGVTFGVATPENTISLTPGSTPAGPGIPNVADVNRDGIADLVTLGSSNNVVVSLGTGGGNFAPAETYPVGEFPVFLKIGDFNGDGWPDIVVTGVSGVQILHNNGDGTFTSPRTITKLYLLTLAVGDFNGDGRLDLVGATDGGPTDGQLYVMLRKPGGGFEQPVVYDIGNGSGIPNGGKTIAVGDFNRDGALDLAVVNGDDSISILLGNGDGTFQPQTVYQTGSSGDFPTALLTADFNGDGKLDLARAAALYTAGVAILLGNGDGTFQTPQLAVRSSAYGLAAGDFNADGKLDLALGLNGSGTGIILGNGDGTFGSLLTFYNGCCGFTPAAADFNNDGRLDLAIQFEVGEGTGVYTVSLWLQ